MYPDWWNAKKPHLQAALRKHGIRDTQDLFMETRRHHGLPDEEDPVSSVSVSVVHSKAFARTS